MQCPFDEVGVADVDAVFVWGRLDCRLESREDDLKMCGYLVVQSVLGRDGALELKLWSAFVVLLYEYNIRIRPKRPWTYFQQDRRGKRYHRERVVVGIREHLARHDRRCVLDERGCLHISEKPGPTTQFHVPECWMAERSALCEPCPL
jgi:hypothetical protein